LASSAPRAVELAGEIEAEDPTALFLVRLAREDKAGGEADAKSGWSNGSFGPVDLRLVVVCVMLL
jgi:hypothetical protein